MKETVAALEGVGKIGAYKDRVKCEILQRDILYIEAIDSSVEVILQEGRYRKESSLTELEKKLDDKVFFRINRQCIVNMAQIEKYEKGIVFIDNKKKKVSQRRKKEFITAYREYMAWR